MFIRRMLGLKGSFGWRIACGWFVREGESRSVLGVRGCIVGVIRFGWTVHVEVDRWN